MDDFISAVEAAMITRAIQVEPWTYTEMRALVREVSSGKVNGRIVDKSHRHWRRNGWATFARVGRDTFWTLTDAGRAALAAQEKTDGE